MVERMKTAEPWGSVASTMTSVRCPIYANKPCGPVVGNPQTYPESDHFSGIWFDGNKVIGHDGHGVAVDAETLNTFRTSIDQSKAVLFPRREFEFGNSGVGRALKKV